MCIGVEGINLGCLGIEPDKNIALSFLMIPAANLFVLNYHIDLTTLFPFVTNNRGTIYHFCFFFKASISLPMAYTNPSLYGPCIASYDLGVEVIFSYQHRQLGGKYCCQLVTSILPVRFFINTRISWSVL